MTSWILSWHSSDMPPIADRAAKANRQAPQLRSSPQRSIEWLLFIYSWISACVHGGDKSYEYMCQYNHFRVTISIPEKMCKQNLLSDYRHFKHSSRPRAALLVGTMHQLKNYLFHFMRCHRHIDKKHERDEEMFDFDRCFPLSLNGKYTT